MLKPDPRTAVSGGVVLARFFEEAGLPDSVLDVLPGGADAGEALVTDPNVPVISFTGSTAAKDWRHRPRTPPLIRHRPGERTSVSLMTLAKVHDQSKGLHRRPDG